MLGRGVLHRLLPFLDLAAGVFQARGALPEVLVFQLQAGWQQVDHQRIRHALFGLHGQMHQHQLTAGEVVEVQRLTVHA